MVVADTSVWIEYFRGGAEPVRATMRALIKGQQAVLVGVVLAELLQGCRSPKEAELILSNLAGLPFLETRYPTWKNAGQLSASLRRKGITLPLSDVIIAALAIEHDCEVYSLDPHFEQIPGLRFHTSCRPARRRSQPTS